MASAHDDVLFFTDRGRVFRIKAYEIPEAGRTARGLALVNLLQLQPDERLAAVIPVTKGVLAQCGEYLTMVTRQGIIKRTEISLFARSKKTGGLIALNIRDGDALVAVLRTNVGGTVFLVTAQGMGIRFGEADIRAVGRTAIGVRGISLREDDFVVGADVVNEDSQILLVSSTGYGKCIDMAKYRIQSRGGKGLTAYKPSDKVGRLVGAAAVTEKDELMLITGEGVVIRLRVGDIRVMGRAAQGVKLIALADGVPVVGMARIAESENSENESESGNENGGTGHDNGHE